MAIDNMLKPTIEDIQRPNITNGVHNAQNNASTSNGGFFENMRRAVIEAARRQQEQQANDIKNAQFSDLSAALKAYSADTSEANRGRLQELAVINNTLNGPATAGLRGAVDAVGAGTMINGWSGGPVAGIAGTLLGGALLTGMGIGEYQANNSMIARRKKLLDELAKYNLDNWTSYKNNAIKATTGKTAADWASEGKMFNDYGELLDIDYDYYSTVPHDTLNRVFGAKGAEYVRKEISKRKLSK